MYYKLSDKELELILKIGEITLTNYQIESGYIPSDNFISLLEDLYYEYESLQEKYKQEKDKN